jgi:hypothetical protein
VASRKMRVVYSREFLISIGESERCKNLPPGVDLSLLKYVFPFVSLVCMLLFAAGFVW